MDTTLDSHFDLGGMYTYSPAPKCSPVLSHKTSRLPRHDRHEIPGLDLYLRVGYKGICKIQKKYFLKNLFP